MARYNVNGRIVDIYCGDTTAHEGGCSGNCEDCRFCEVEENRAVYPFVGSWLYKLRQSK